MKSGSEKKSRIRRSRWVIPVAIVAALAAAFLIYVSDYYRADATAIAAMQPDETVRVTQTRYGWLFDGPSEDAALIFYPGGKVEETAYAPLLHRLASKGMDACLVKMPFRLAIFNRGAAEEIMEQHPYSEWYVGGHSLGGAMAAGWAADHADRLSGVILLAAYPTGKLLDSLNEILLVGSEDRVINWDRIQDGRRFASMRYVEHVIEGGNHAQFGSYGEQKGDGAAVITAEEQMEEAARIIMETIRRDP